MKKKKRSKSNGNHSSWWWLAINGASCAASGFPMPMAVQVSPTPEQLLGFRTREEQIATQRFIINAPIAEVERYMTKTIPAKIKSGEVAYMRPSRPEPPTEGPTMWMAQPASGQSDHEQRMLVDARDRIEMAGELGRGKNWPAHGRTGDDSGRHSNTTPKGNTDEHERN